MSRLGAGILAGMGTIAGGLAGLVAYDAAPNFFSGRWSPRDEATAMGIGAVLGSVLGAALGAGSSKPAQVGTSAPSQFEPRFP